MSKKPKQSLHAVAGDHLSKALYDKAVKEFNDTPKDNSPQLDMICLHQVVEQVARLNLGNLVHDFTAMRNELPGLQVGNFDASLNEMNQGFLMAIAFESGRRYNLLQVFQILSDEVETLPNEASETNTLPLMEM